MTIVAGRFALEEKIGMGGMGAVYRGIDHQTGAIVAIKELLPQYLQTNRDAVERFIREGEALRQLNHPNIVKMVAAVEEADHYYLIMEYIAGGSLADLLKEEPQLPIKRVLEIGLDLADALTRAHRLDIIHRDIKPHNVLIAADGTPRLTDFGVARMGNSDITETGVVIGTLTYLSPEAVNGKTIDTRSDIWSLGVMLFEMLTGRPAFIGETIQQQLLQILFEPMPDLEKFRPDAPVGLTDLLYRMLAKLPEERIPSVRIVGTELEALLHGNLPTVSLEPESKVAELHQSAHLITPTPTIGSHRHNLPSQTTLFLGREDELLHIATHLADPHIRLITILGPGGMGKTRLSIAAGEAQLPRFDNGVFFIELAPLTGYEGIPNAIANAVGYPFQPDQRTPQQQLVDYFREKQQLLIFDNFEHVLEGAAYIGEILKHAPAVKILVTSRERLNLRDETLFLLGGMDFPQWRNAEDALGYAAVKLFLQSARRVQPTFTLKEDTLHDVARICQLVSGMPLGIVLAASWLEMLSLEEIATEIARSLDFLETEQRDVPDRQRSLRAIFDYSWMRLTPQEQQALMGLSVFRGGLTREAAQVVGEATLKQLQSFVNKSLLNRNATTGRFETHELVRQYAADYLRASATVTATKDAHMRYYAALMERLEPDLKGKSQLEALNQIETDFENVKAAWEWAVQQGHLSVIHQMAESLYVFCTFRSRYADGEMLFEQARQRWASSTDLMMAHLLVRFTPAAQPPLPFAELALQIAQQHQAVLETAIARQVMGRYLSHQRVDVARGIILIEESIDAFRSLNDLFYQAQALDDLAWAYFIAMQLEKRLQVAEASVALRRKMGDLIGVANALRSLGSTMVMMSRYDDAINYLREAGEIAREMKDLTSIAWTNGMLGYRLLTKNKLEEAEPLLREGVRITTEINLLVVKTQCSFLLATLLCIQGQYAEARQIAFEEIPEKDESFDIALRGPCTGARSVVAIGLQDYSYLEYLFNLISGHPQKSRGFIPIMGWFTMTAVYLGVLLAHWNYKEAAVESFAFAFSHPQRDTRWLEQWGVIQQHMTQLRESMTSTAYAEAWERGKTKSREAIFERWEEIYNQQALL